MTGPQGKMTPATQKSGLSAARQAHQNSNMAKGTKRNIYHETTGEHIGTVRRDSKGGWHSASKNSLVFGGHNSKAAAIKALHESHGTDKLVNAQFTSPKNRTPEQRAVMKDEAKANKSVRDQRKADDARHLAAVKTVGTRGGRGVVNGKVVTGKISNVNGHWHTTTLAAHGKKFISESTKKALLQKIAEASRLG
jgi:hypothetical protein